MLLQIEITWNESIVTLIYPTHDGKKRFFQLNPQFSPGPTPDNRGRLWAQGKNPHLLKTIVWSCLSGKNPAKKNPKTSSSFQFFQNVMEHWVREKSKSLLSNILRLTNTKDPLSRRQKLFLKKHETQIFFQIVLKKSVVET